MLSLPQEWPASPWADLNCSEGRVGCVKSKSTYRNLLQNGSYLSFFFARIWVFRVQVWFADDGAENGDETFEGVTCLACRRVHMVNPRTGKILGES